MVLCAAQCARPSGAAQACRQGTSTVSAPPQRAAAPASQDWSQRAARPAEWVLGHETEPDCQYLERMVKVYLEIDYDIVHSGRTAREAGPVPLPPGRRRAGE